jgi:alpha-D-xyloside xylohydrolase
MKYIFKSRLYLLVSFLVIMLFLLESAFGMTNAANHDFEKTTNGIKTEIGNTIVSVTFYNANTVRVVKYPKGTDFVKESLSVIAKPEAVSVKTSRQGNKLSVRSNQLNLIIDTNKGVISFFDAAGNLLIKENNVPIFTKIDDAGVPSFEVTQAFKLDENEAIYGLGQLQNGKMSQRGTTKKLIQGNTEDVITFFQSVKGYGLFWDNYSPTLFSDSKDETYFKSDVGDCVDYYLMYGKNADGVVAEMRNLTGDVPLFPLWTYGFFQSKERYKSQDETTDVVRKYRELGVPLDGIIQDWQYWGSNYLWNAMEFLNENFPNPKKMMSDVHKMNAKMVISIWSSFGPMTKQYRIMEPQGMLLDMGTWPQSGSSIWPPKRDYPSGVKPYDPFNPKARDIYWEHLNEGLFSLGMDGWWMDSTEPDHLDAKDEDLDLQTYMGSLRKVRNAYPLMSVGGVYDHQRAVSNDKRVFILTRSAFAGQQRYGANTWTGDVQATWDDLARQIPAGLNFSLCAIPHWNSDIGGFFLSRYPNKLEDPDYRELYTRWLQFGAFSPMMRSHGADAPREIWQFGKKGEPYYDAIEKFINLRYKLIPYIYSVSWDVTKNRSSMIRSLVMDFHKDSNCWDIADQFMFGKSLLISPVIEPMYTKVVSGEGRNIKREADFSTVKSRDLYLPNGADWYDFWTNERYNGGVIIKRNTPIDLMPIHVKAGSILPFGPQVQYVEEKKWDDLEIRVYKGADGSFILYEDEFDNYNYENGAYSEIKFNWNDKNRRLTIENRSGEYPGMLQQRRFRVKLIEPNKVNDERTVEYSGNKVVLSL